MAVTTFDGVWLTGSTEEHEGTGTVTSVGDVITCSISGGFDDVLVGSTIEVYQGETHILIEKTSGSVGIIDRAPYTPYSAKAWTYFLPALTATEAGASGKQIACVTDKYTCFKTNSSDTPFLILDGIDNTASLEVEDSWIRLTQSGMLLKQVQSSLLLSANSAKLDCLYSKLHFESGFSLLTHGDAKLLLDGPDLNATLEVLDSKLLLESSSAELKSGTTSVVVSNDGDISFDVDSVPGALLIDGTTGVVSHAIKEAVMLRTAYFIAPTLTITTIPFTTPVFDCANNISVSNNTFTPKADGIYAIDINLITHPTALATAGASIFCQMYKDGTTPPTLDTAYGSSYYDAFTPISVRNVSLSWTSELEANTAYKFSLYPTNTLSTFIFYAGTSILDCTLRITKT